MKDNQDLSSYRIMKISSVLVTGLVAGAAFLSFNGVATAHAWTQHTPALSNYNVRNYRTVNNANYFRNRYNFSGSKNYYSDPEGQNKRETLSTIKGNKKIALISSIFLPIHYNSANDTKFQNPQSVAFVNNYAYIMYTNSADSNEGFVVRYDTNKLTLSDGHLADIRQATYDKANGDVNSDDKKILSAIKVGPDFYTGHGQSLAYNPKSKELWFVTKSDINAQVERLNPNTLKPNESINFKLKSTVPMGEVLTFDKNGNAYFYGYASGGWAPKGSIKIYRGHISSSKGVHFSLVMQGIRHSTGTKDQSMGYNPKTNRIYFVSDGSISSVPVNKLGHLSPSDVQSTWFSGHREFEAYSSDEDGNSFLLTNRGPELMLGVNYK